jgi:hypothetical protein
MTPRSGNFSAGSRRLSGERRCRRTTRRTAAVGYGRWSSGVPTSAAAAGAIAERGAARSRPGRGRGAVGTRHRRLLYVTANAITLPDEAPAHQASSDPRHIPPWRRPGYGRRRSGMRRGTTRSAPASGCARTGQGGTRASSAGATTAPPGWPTSTGRRRGHGARALRRPGVHLPRGGGGGHPAGAARRHPPRPDCQNRSPPTPGPRSIGVAGRMSAAPIAGNRTPPHGWWIRHDQDMGSPR